MFGRSQPDSYALAEDDSRLCLTLMPTASGGRHEGWKSFFTALAVEVACLAILFGAVPGVAPTPPSHETKHPRKPPVIVVFSPTAGRKPAATVVPAVAAPVVASAHPGAKVDMSAIQISIADDSSNQLPEVLRQQGGMLAFLEASDPSIAVYTFQPPEWHMQKETVDITAKVRFTMTPLSKWPLFQSLASSNGIEAGRYEMDALFDGNFVGCLQQEIQKTADASGKGKVRAVTLVFSSERRCGVDVLNVQFAMAK